MIEERIEKLQSDLGKVQAELGELKTQLKPKPEDRFVPKIWQEYWFINEYGNEDWDTWQGSSGDNFRLATGNVHRTKEEARRYKASLLLKTPTGACPSGACVLFRWDIGLKKAVEIASYSRVGPAQFQWWNLGMYCLKGYEKDLEAKWRKYGWSVTGEHEPEGWES